MFKKLTGTDLNLTIQFPSVSQWSTINCFSINQLANTRLEAYLHRNSYSLTNTTRYFHVSSENFDAFQSTRSTEVSTTSFNPIFAEEIRQHFVNNSQKITDIFHFYVLRIIFLILDAMLLLHRFSFLHRNIHLLQKNQSKVKTVILNSPSGMSDYYVQSFREEPNQSFDTTVDSEDNAVESGSETYASIGKQSAAKRIKYSIEKKQTFETHRCNGEIKSLSEYNLIHCPLHGNSQQITCPLGISFCSSSHPIDTVSQQASNRCSFLVFYWEKFYKSDVIPRAVIIVFIVLLLYLALRLTNCFVVVDKLLSVSGLNRLKIMAEESYSQLAEDLHRVDLENHKYLTDIFTTHRDSELLQLREFTNLCKLSKYSIVICRK